MMATVLIIIEMIAITSAIVALVFARSAAAACRSAAAEARRASEIWAKAEAAILASASRSLSASHRYVAFTYDEEIVP